MNMNVKIIRVAGIRSKSPAVLAVVDGLLVKWGSRRFWSCACLADPDTHECKHIAAVQALLDDRVTTPHPLEMVQP
ncbi:MULTISPECIES: hypothetical protein [unclassified Cryobacterium]|uniref:hypothetical protein n=1 Tax=unclassified Cryobacterium TaxID=2649013 RepID=UPI00106B25C4|nr:MULTISPECIES: hypothetical protein [unclassified Cryobacterium]TFC00257.1 hypothetical protein E3O39_01730 [Cryobacterium sp. MDB2-A-1]TFC14121.1 hypothetical protein E3O35_04000 [Cryobacterium sp. MDB2-A-2]